MSVLFATVATNCIILCADKLSVNKCTGETGVVTKIERWAPAIAVGGTGNAALSDIVISGVHNYVKSEGFENFTLEEIGELVGQCYYAARETYADMPKDVFAQIVVAGRLSNGKAGAVQILLGDDNADMEVIEAQNVPTSLILAPDDMTEAECDQLLKKAFLNTKNKNTHQRDILEAVHRKAVRYVSERSAYVGPKADYIVIDLR